MRRIAQTALKKTLWELEGTPRPDLVILARMLARRLDEAIDEASDMALARLSQEYRAVLRDLLNSAQQDRPTTDSFEEALAAFRAATSGHPSTADPQD